MESEKIKKALSCQSTLSLPKCEKCDYKFRIVCKTEKLLEDALTLIAELESENEALQKGVKRLKSKYKETIKKNADECVKKFCETTMYKEQEKLVNENQQLKDRIAELEDKIENGTLIELPCKVGDDVWAIMRQRDTFTDETYRITLRIPFRLSDLNDIGETVFLTKAEAEAKLKELQ